MLCVHICVRMCAHVCMCWAGCNQKGERGGDQEKGTASV